MSPAPHAPPTLAGIRAAAERIRPHARRTPVLTCRAIDERAGCTVFLKCENLQRVGAFKFRGACNAIFSLSDAEAARGIATQSSGNHAQAIALAARLRGVPAHIVMPRTSPKVKLDAVAGYGGRITLCEPTLRSRDETLARVAAETGATVIHPYNDARVIAGQGTSAMELLDEVPDLDIVMAPVSGGGLLSGTAIAATSIKPGIRVIGAEPEGADDAFRSFAAGRIIPCEKPDSICDGLLAGLCPLTFGILRERVEGIVTLSERSIIDAMRFVWERAKLVIEPSAAVPIAALLEGKIEPPGRRIGVIISGGNVDLDRLPWQR